MDDVHHLTDEFLLPVAEVEFRGVMTGVVGVQVAGLDREVHERWLDNALALLNVLLGRRIVEDAVVALAEVPQAFPVVGIGLRVVEDGVKGWQPALGVDLAQEPQVGQPGRAEQRALRAPAIKDEILVKRPNFKKKISRNLHISSKRG